MQDKMDDIQQTKEQWMHQTVKVEKEIEKEGLSKGHRGCDGAAYDGYAEVKREVMQDAVRENKKRKDDMDVLMEIVVIKLMLRLQQPLQNIQHHI